MFYGKISVVVRLVGIVVFFSVTLLDYTHIKGVRQKSCEYLPIQKSGDFYFWACSINIVLS